MSKQGLLPWPWVTTVVVSAGLVATTSALLHRWNKLMENESINRRKQENLRAIMAVLKYWFGQASPDVNQKRLWMVQDPKRQLSVDCEIFWKFGSLLSQLSLRDSDKRKKWCSDNEDLYGFHGKLAAIIVLDQFSRHIHRHLLHSNTTHSLNLPDQKVMDNQALKIAQAIVKGHQSEMESGMVPLPMYIFALMPFRHASTLETVQYVNNEIETKLAPLVDQVDTMVKRFRKATNRRLAVLQDDARRSGSIAKTTDTDRRKHQFTDEEILETTPFEADLSSTSSHIVHSTIVKFLAERGIKPRQRSNRSGHSSEVVTPVVVSLSGGVDSMVIAAVLADLVHAHDFDASLRVIAVHIDYANRPESMAEASFVERWCKDHKIDFYCRRIDEVTRGITARDEYEAISRNVRYSFYQHIIGKYSQDYNSSVEIGVMLGHHRGDLRENVLSNAHKGCGPLDLSGMTPVCVNNGVTLLRPLLPLEKKEVFDYAHKYGVPYFKDTTPHWSTRGKLRNKLLPLLQEIYGEGCLNNLSQLAVESDQCRSLVHAVSLGPFLDAIVRKPMGIKMETGPYKSNDLFFWKVVLREALHSASLGMFSDKAIESFLKRVQVGQPKEGWLQCRKDYAVYLRGDGAVFVLYPASFPWRKAEAYNHMTPNGAVDSSTPISVGPWKILVEEIGQKSVWPTDWDSLLEQKAIGSMEEFLEGSFSYYLRVPSGKKLWLHPLVFRSFKKVNRPQSWKGVDIKIQDTLPLLGFDDTSVDESCNQKIFDSIDALVKISYKLEVES
mmetsp:Transcript_26015/g.59844  ORF Transcript_26015/g.59844 Transcript_26015/m.59844 type:complete len:780 (-) Transcript_26015:149-2488(-)